MKKLSDVALSVLDLAPVTDAGNIRDTLQNTADLACHVERLGFTRYWMAEHHNLEGIASAATVVLIGFVAGQTSTIRVGSGGIMLPNHAPLIVAEQFGTLATLYPDRIDLGLGRAPGTDPATMRALRRSSTNEDFSEQLGELLYFLEPASLGQKIKAIPGAGVSIPVWILGSSLYSARLAARLGLPYAFAGHFAPAALLQALDLYRTEFQASSRLSKPHVMVGVHVVAAASDSEARYQATSLYQKFLSLIRGHLEPLHPPVRSMENLWNEAEKAMVESMLRYSVVGGVESVHQGLQHLIDLTGADELMINSELFSHQDRKASFARISEAWKSETAINLNAYF